MSEKEILCPRCSAKGVVSRTEHGFVVIWKLKKGRKMYCWTDRPSEIRNAPGFEYGCGYDRRGGGHSPEHLKDLERTGGHLICEAE